MKTTKTMIFLIFLISLAMLTRVIVPVYAVQPKKLVINITYKVINDEDFGWGSWYWAITNYNVHVQVWQLADGSYFAEKTYIGFFYVPMGALSPNVGVVEPKDGFGRLDSYYTVKFKGTLKTDVQLNGFIGTKDFRGKIDDILLGTGGSGAPGSFNWINEYFSSWSDRVFLTDLWTYKLCDDPEATASSMVQTVYSVLIPTITGDIIT